MGARARSVVGALVAVLVTAAPVGCGDAGSLDIENNGPDDVVVDTGDEPPFTVDGTGGALLLDYGCSPGNVVVRFPGGREVTVPGPVCPSQRIVVGDGTAELLPAG